MDYESRDLSQLIEQALKLADERDLDLVSIKLDEARAALDAGRGASATLSRMDDLIKTLPASVPVRSVSGSNVITLRAPTSLERLLGEHQALDKRRRALMELVRNPPNAAEAERQLIEFGKLIDDHRATERRCVYGPLLAVGVNADTALEERLASLVGEMETDWDSYLHTWDRQKIENDWREFTAATNTILARAGERMRLEEKIIYPLAFMSGLIHLRESAG